MMRLRLTDEDVQLRRIRAHSGSLAMATLCVQLLTAPAWAACPDGVCTVSTTGTDADRGAALITALSDAVCGDHIVLTAGYTFHNAAGYVLPNKTPACGGLTEANYITVRTSNLAGLPSSGTRVVPATHAAAMATVTCGSDGCMVFRDWSGSGPQEAAGWIFIGLEVTSSGDFYSNGGFWFVGAVPSAQVGFIFDRLYIHPQEATPADNAMEEYGTFRSGIVLSVTHAIIRDSFITVGWPKIGAGASEGQGTDGIGVLAAAGSDVVVQNNYIQSSFNPLFLGGGAPADADRTMVIQASPAPTTSSATVDDLGDLVVGDYVAFRVRADDDPDTLNPSRAPKRWSVGQIATINTETKAITWTQKFGSLPSILDATATVNNSGGYSEGATELAFDAINYDGGQATYLFQAGVRLVITGHTSTYLVQASVSANLPDGTATLTISPGLEASIADNLAVTFTPPAPIGYQDWDLAPMVGEGAYWRGGKIEDVTIRQNTIEGWPENTSLGDDVSGLLKSWCEMKAGTNVLWEGNFFTTHAKRGGSLTLYPQNDNGATPWVEVSGVVVRNNWFRNSLGHLQALAASYNFADYAHNTGNDLRNNVFEGVTAANDAGGWGFVILRNWHGVAEALVTHNTTVVPDSGNAKWASVFPDAHAIQDSTIRDNIIWNGQYGWSCEGYAGGYSGWDEEHCHETITFTKNLIIDNRTSDNWPYTLEYPATNIFGNYHTAADVKFRNAGIRDYRLLATSPGYRAASDGTDIGVDFKTLYQAMGTQTWSDAGLTWRPTASGPVVIGGGQ